MTRHRRDAGATDFSDLSKSDERDSGKTDKGEGPADLSLPAEVRGKFPAVIFLNFKYNAYKTIVQGDWDRSYRGPRGRRKFGLGGDSSRLGLVPAGID